MKEISISGWISPFTYMMEMYQILVLKIGCSVSREAYRNLVELPWRVPKF